MALLSLLHHGILVYLACSLYHYSPMHRREAIVRQMVETLDLDNNNNDDDDLTDIWLKLKSRTSWISYRRTSIFCLKTK